MDDRKRHPYWYANRETLPPTFIHQQPSNMPNYPYTPISHITPYERYAKPPQPLNLMSQSQEVYGNPPEQPQAGILRAFTDANGQVDFDKTITTINQLASTYHQVSPIVRQLSTLIKTLGN